MVLSSMAGRTMTRIRQKLPAAEWRAVMQLICAQNKLRSPDEAARRLGEDVEELPASKLRVVVLGVGQFLYEMLRAPPAVSRSTDQHERADFNTLFSSAVELGVELLNLSEDEWGGENDSNLTSSQQVDVAVTRANACGTVSPLLSRQDRGNLLDLILAQLIRVEVVEPTMALLLNAPEEDAGKVESCASLLLSMCLGRRPNFKGLSSILLKQLQDHPQDADAGSEGTPGEERQILALAGKVGSLPSYRVQLSVLELLYRLHKKWVYKGKEAAAATAVEKACPSPLGEKLGSLRSGYFAEDARDLLNLFNMPQTELNNIQGASQDPFRGVKAAELGEVSQVITWEPTVDHKHRTKLLREEGSWLDVSTPAGNIVFEVGASADEAIAVTVPFSAIYEAEIDGGGKSGDGGTGVRVKVSFKDVPSLESRITRPPPGTTTCDLLFRLSNPRGGWGGDEHSPEYPSLESITATLEENLYGKDRRASIVAQRTAPPRQDLPEQQHGDERGRRAAGESSRKSGATTPSAKSGAGARMARRGQRVDSDEEANGFDGAEVGQLRKEERSEDEHDAAPAGGKKKKGAKGREARDENRRGVMKSSPGRQRRPQKEVQEDEAEKEPEKEKRSRRAPPKKSRAAKTDSTAARAPARGGRGKAGARKSKSNRLPHGGEQDEMEDEPLPSPSLDAYDDSGLASPPSPSATPVPFGDDSEALSTPPRTKEPKAPAPAPRSRPQRKQRKGRDGDAAFAQHSVHVEDEEDEVPSEHEDMEDDEEGGGVHEEEEGRRKRAREEVDEEDGEDDGSEGHEEQSDHDEHHGRGAGGDEEGEGQEEDDIEESRGTEEIDEESESDGNGNDEEHDDEDEDEDEGEEEEEEDEEEEEGESQAELNVLFAALKETALAVAERKKRKAVKAKVKSIKAEGSECLRGTKETFVNHWKASAADVSKQGEMLFSEAQNAQQQLESSHKDHTQLMTALRNRMDKKIHASEALQRALDELLHKGCERDDAQFEKLLQKRHKERLAIFSREAANGPKMRKGKGKGKATLTKGTKSGGKGKRKGQSTGILDLIKGLR